MSGLNQQLPLLQRRFQCLTEVLVYPDDAVAGNFLLSTAISVKMHLLVEISMFSPALSNALNGRRRLMFSQKDLRSVIKKLELMCLILSLTVIFSHSMSPARREYSSS